MGRWWWWCLFVCKPSVILILCSGVGTISLLRFSTVMTSCSIRGSIFWCFPTPLLPSFRVQSQLVITGPFLLKGRSDSYSISLSIWYKNSFWYYLFSVKWRKPTSSSVPATCSFVRIFFLLPLVANQFLSMVTTLWNIWDSSSFERHQNRRLQELGVSFHVASCRERVALSLLLLRVCVVQQLSELTSWGGGMLFACLGVFCWLDSNFLCQIVFFLLYLWIQACYSSCLMRIVGLFLMTYSCSV